MAKKKGKGKAKKTLPFRHHLVLHQWLFSLFGLDSVSGNVDQGDREVPSLEAFCERFQLHGETAGRNAEGEHALIRRIRENLTDDVALTDDELLEYDRQIGRAHV